MDQPLRPRVLESLYQHRLLTSSQLAEIFSPRSHPGWLRRVMAALAASGLVDRIRLRPPASQAVWFLTPAGAQLVELGHSGTWRRRYVVTPDVATGPLQAHMLAENDVGIAFMRAARRHNHECGYLGWRHEVAHKLPGGSGSVIADVLLHYVAVGAGTRGSDVVLWRFFEVDRGHMPRAVLVEKLQDYVALYRGYLDAMGGKSPHPPRWVERYPSFPAVVLVFTNAEHRLLMSRIRSVAEICRRDRVVGATRLPIVFTTLEDLQTRGPFAPIFWPVGDRDRPVDVMGQSVRPTGANRRHDDRRFPANRRWWRPEVGPTGVEEDEMEERRRWWSTCEVADPEATHVVTFRPVVRVRLALVPGADASAVIAGAVASWTEELASTPDGDGRWSSELWGTALAGEGVVLDVDVVAEHTVEELG